MKLILDRIEETQGGKKIAVFECGDNFYNIHEDNMPLGLIKEIQCGTILEAEIEDGNLLSPKILYEETEIKQNEMKNRLKNLFNRNKK